MSNTENKTPENNLLSSEKVTMELGKLVEPYMEKASQIHVNGFAILKAATYAIKCHRDTNHRYNEHPYEYHLKMVFEYGFKYRHLLPEEVQGEVLAACWTHDLIEDCRQTYNDVKGCMGEFVANLSYALTNEKGKNRKERANDKYYAGIVDTDYAAFVKLCDRLANVKHNVDIGGSMLYAYRKEQKAFEEYLYMQVNDPYHEMWIELDELLK